jgi:hypothetical protein
MKQQRADSNPYPFEDERVWAWASGYIEGKANPDTLPQMRPMLQNGVKNFPGSWGKER